MTGIEEMRAAVELFEMCYESFNEQYAVPDLLKIYRAYTACEWFVLPDRWTERQLSEVLSSGRVPSFIEPTHLDRRMFNEGRLRMVDGLVPTYGPHFEPAYLPEPGKTV